MVGKQKDVEVLRDQAVPARLIPLGLKRSKVMALSAHSGQRMYIDTFFTRVLGGLLLISLPTMVILGGLMFAQGLGSTSDAAKVHAEASATVTVSRIQDWLREPQDYLSHIARESRATIGTTPNGESLKNAANAFFDAIEVVGSDGRLVATTAAYPDLEDIHSSEWFQKL